MATATEFVGYDGEPVGVGDRVELHPACDLWMRGARYGYTRAIGNTDGGEPTFQVSMDHYQAERLVRVKASLLRRVR